MILWKGRTMIKFSYIKIGLKSKVIRALIQELILLQDIQIIQGIVLSNVNFMPLIIALKNLILIHSSRQLQLKTL